MYPKLSSELAMVAYGTSTLSWLVLAILITPPQEQISIEAESSAGILSISTVGAPGTHGTVIIGTQGMGVSTPSAAAVAKATVGLVIEEHMPKGGMLTSDALSMMFAAGPPAAITRLVGNTTSDDGAAPKLHCIVAPMHTCCAIQPLPN
jgi:hypothetical protein